MCDASRADGEGGDALMEAEMLQLGRCGEPPNGQGREWAGKFFTRKREINRAMSKKQTNGDVNLVLEPRSTRRWVRVDDAVLGLRWTG
jgi:hypothetical protein